MGTDNNALDIYNGCSIAPVDTPMDLSSNRSLTKLVTSKKQQTQLAALANSLPATLAAKNAGNCFYVDLPSGVSIDDLVHYKDGGVGSMVMGEHGIEGHVGFHQLAENANILAAFSVMSLATNQYFLSQINNNLAKIAASIDKILSFLYGEMRAELLAEVKFVKLAQSNYNSIMNQSEQRTATLASLQRAKNVAMKDIEFYLGDMEEKVADKKGELSNTVADLVKGKECVDLASQLYTMTCLLDVFYSQNFDPNYISYIKSEASEILGICEKRLITCFSTLQNDIQKSRNGLTGKIGKAGLQPALDTVLDILGDLSDHAVPLLTQTMNAALDEVVKEKRFYLSKDGEVYYKAS